MAFAGNAAMAQTIKDGGTLRAALTGEPDLLDPASLHDLHRRPGL